MLKTFFCNTGKLRHFLMLIVLLAFQKQIKAQACIGCITTINSNSSANVTIGPSDFVCISPGVTVTGNITLNGGKLCNQGTVSNLTLIKGYFYNYGSFSKPNGNLTVSNAKNLWIECYPNSGFDLSNSMNIDAESNLDSIMINVYKGAKFSIGKNLTITKGWLKIRNGLNASSAESLPIQSYINIGGQLNVSSSALRILNTADGLINITGVVNLDAKYNKTILNYGLFSCNSSFNITGNGQNTYKVLIDNNGTFNIAANLSSAYNNGTVTINNNSFPVKPQPSFSIGKTLSLTKSDNVFNNKTILNIGLDAFIENASLTNAGKVYVDRDVEVKAGTITNANQMFILRDFLVSNINGTVNENGYLSVGRVFNNAGIFSMSKYAYLNTTNYYNLNNGTINGPSTISNDNEYAIIFIKNQSQNTGYINGNVLIYDQTLVGTTGNEGYGFDLVTQGNRISNTVLFAVRSAGPNNPPLINCRALQNLFGINAPGPLSVNCPGDGITLFSQFQQIASGGNINFPLSNTSYTWQPGNLIGQSVAVNPTVTTTYTVYAKHPNGCVFQTTLTVNVPNISAPTISYTTLAPFSSTATVSFPITISGAPTGGVFWYNPGNGLNINLTNGTITNPTCAQGTYTVYYQVPEGPFCYSLYTASVVITIEYTDCFFEISPNKASLCVGDQILLNTIGGGPDGFTWTPSTNLSCTNCASPVLTYTGSPNQYTITSSRNGVVCGSTIFTITPRADCVDNSIVGCCFSNYGAVVYVNDVNTHINVYCNLVNELGQYPSFAIKKGEFQSEGNVNVKYDWIHNAQNNLYNTKQGNSSFFGNDQNMKGNSNTHFNYLLLNGNGVKKIWIDEYAHSDLDLTTNELSIQNFSFFMKNPSANSYRSSGFASSGVNGYFSTVLGPNSGPIKKNLYPLGSKATMLQPYRYRPLEISNNNSLSSDEVSANFMNIPPALISDVVFVNSTFSLTNIVTDKAPSILSMNTKYYHKLKNTVTPAPTFTSDIAIKSYYLSVDGSYQSLTEWEKSTTSQLDWWGSTPGGTGSGIPSTNPGTFGQVYAESSGLQTFNGKPYALAQSGIYINTSAFGGTLSTGSGTVGTVITVSAVPTNSTSTTTNTTTVISGTTTAVATNTTTTVVLGGVTTSTTTSTTGTVTTVLTSTTTTSGGVTTTTTSSTTGTVTTVTSSTTAPGVGGTTTSTVSTTTGTLTTVTTTTTTPPVGGVSSTTLTSTGGGTTTTTTSTVTNNGNTSTSVTNVVTVVGTSTTVTTQTCVAIATGTVAVTTCSTQVGTNPITVSTTTASSIGTGNPINIPIGGGLNLPYGTGPLSGNILTNTNLNLSPNPVSNDYVITINPLTGCEIGSKIKFTVTPSGTINPTSVVYGTSASPGYLGELSPDVYTIDNVNSGIILSSTPKDILAACINTIVITTTGASDYTMNKSNTGEQISVTIPSIGGLTIGSFQLFDAAMVSVQAPVPLSFGTNLISVAGFPSTISNGVYNFEFQLIFGANTETVKGQFIIKP